MLLRKHIKLQMLLYLSSLCNILLITKKNVRKINHNSKIFKKINIEKCPKSGNKIWQRIWDREKVACNQEERMTYLWWWIWFLLKLKSKSTTSQLILTKKRMISFHWPVLQKNNINRNNEIRLMYETNKFKN